MSRRQEGFTLVELMVVVLIIGILVAIAIPVYQVVRGRTATRACFASERTLEGAAASWESSTGLSPSSLGNWSQLTGALVPTFVVREPVCPANGTYTWVAPDVTCSQHGNYKD
jgi:prepilin-type N-terminal cleavage/methylation domain-containing protein